MNKEEIISQIEEKSCFDTDQGGRVYKYIELDDLFEILRQSPPVIQGSAKQIKEAARVKADPIMGSFEDAFVFSSDEMQAFEDAICREQRELCSDISYNSDGSDQIINEILNTPKPTT